MKIKEMQNIARFAYVIIDETLYDSAWYCNDVNNFGISNYVDLVRSQIVGSFRVWII